MMTRLRRTALVAALLCSTTAVFGADFDGSKQLICATVDAHACDPGEVCLRGLPDDVGVPRFMRIDFAKKTIAGPKRTTQIRCSRLRTRSCSCCVPRVRVPTGRLTW